MMSKIKFLFFVMCLGFFSLGSAQGVDFPSAEESDPRILGWMNGFPPPPDKLIMQPQSNYFSFP